MTVTRVTAVTHVMHVSRVTLVTRTAVPSHPLYIFLKKKREIYIQEREQLSGGVNSMKQSKKRKQPAEGPPVVGQRRLCEAIARVVA